MKDHSTKKAAESASSPNPAARIGWVTRTLASACLCVLALLAVDGGTKASAAQSIARVWDEEILDAIRIDLPNPPVHARNLFHFSACAYDAWAAYDPKAAGFVYRGKHTAADVAAARREAISHAAYRILKERYALSRNAARTLPALDARMAALGYDTNNVSLDVSTPAGLGNRVAAEISAYCLNDGALQSRGYKDLPLGQGGYAPFNPPLIAGRDGVLIWNASRWQPLALSDALSQNGIPIEALQRFQGSQWKWVRPFALTRTDSNQPWIDPGPPPQLNGAGDALYRSEVVSMVRLSSQLTPDDGVVADYSPGAFGNNPLGANDGKGRPLNPATGQPYAPNVLKRGDFARVLAEFWADGPNSETPPGHWNTIANAVADSPSLVRKIGGVGPTLDDLEWDVKIYFAMNAALHDAACAAWSLKRHYDGWRPVSAVRLMGQRGQSSNPNGPSYHPAGFPIVPNLIELVTPETAKAGGRHAGLQVGGIAILSWPGQPEDPTNHYSGVRWINAPAWVTYQKKTFVTPAFPGYVSGHSAFSRAAAEVLASATGSEFFPGGLGVFTARAGTFLTTEKGPTTDVPMQWATYYDAADQAGLSRLWGGIHPSVDDVTGRRVGSQAGKTAWALATRYFDGSVAR